MRLSLLGSYAAPRLGLEPAGGVATKDPIATTLSTTARIVSRPSHRVFVKFMRAPAILTLTRLLLMGV